MASTAAPQASEPPPGPSPLSYWKDIDGLRLKLKSWQFLFYKKKKVTVLEASVTLEDRDLLWPLCKSETEPQLPWRPQALAQVTFRQC